MSETFYVRLTLYFRDGTTSESIVPLLEAIKLDRLLKSGGDAAQSQDSLVDLHYTTLKELPGDDQQTP